MDPQIASAITSPRTGPLSTVSASRGAVPDGLTLNHDVLGQSVDTAAHPQPLTFAWCTRAELPPTKHQMRESAQ